MNGVVSDLRSSLVLTIVFLLFTLISAKTFQVKENSPEGTLVVDILKEFNLNIPTDQQSKISFTITNNLPQFSLSSKGQLKLTKFPLDREELCQGSGPCMRSLRASLVQPRQYFQNIDISIEITDENDNEPIFSSPTFNINILENVGIGAQYNLPLATDRDVGQNDVQTYEIEDESVLDLPFELKTKQINSRARKQISLRVKKELDRETKSSYQFRIIAKDGGEPEPKIGYLTVNVNVVDVNDNAPVFDKPFYQVMVNEDHPLNKLIVVVKATDADDGENGEIKYEMEPGQWEEEEIFHLNEVTGELSLAKPFDSSKRSEYLVGIMATDLGQEGLSNFTKVEILVEDINDNAPQLIVTPLTAGEYAEVQENVEAGTFVLHLLAKDIDRGANGRVNCSLVNSFPSNDIFALEHISGNEFQLVTLSDNIDREVSQSYRLTFQCYDFGVPVLSSTDDVVIKVIDVDDNPPFFEKKLYVVEVLENNLLNHLLLQVMADDPDSGINSTFRFGLHPDSLKSMDGVISVDEDSGEIVALKSFDFEIQKEYRFRVIVDNKCQTCLHKDDSPTNTTAEVLLKIFDTNDNAPEFMRKTHKFEIPENSPLSTEVGVIRALDKDSEPYNNFTFKIQKYDQSSFLPFIIDYISGKIITTASLDREFLSSYNFSVIVTDVTNPALFSSTPVEIKILDLNDNNPIFVNDCQNSKTDLGLIESEIIEVCRFVATDPDEGDNGRVTYSLAREIPNKIFNISSKDGTLFLRTFSLIDAPKDLFVNSTAILNVTILAKDSGNPQLSTILRTTAEVNLLSAFSMDALRERRDGYFAGRPLRIFGLCAGILLCLLLITIPIVIISERRRKAHAMLLRPRVDIQPKRPMTIPRDPNASGDDSADEMDKLKSMNENNSNNNKIALNLPTQKFYDDDDERGQTLKYNFGDVIPDSSLIKKKGKCNNDNNQFFSLSRKRKGSVGDKNHDKKDLIYKPSADPPKKQPTFFNPQISFDEPYNPRKGSHKDIPSPSFNNGSKANVNVDIWNGTSIDQSSDPNFYRNSTSPPISNDENPYSKVSTFFEYQNNGQRKPQSNSPTKTDSRNNY